MAALIRRVAPAGRSIARLAAGLWEDVEAFVLPMRCPSCGHELDRDLALCPACASAIPRLDGPLCVRCLAAGRDPPGCLREAGFRAHAAWIYDERAARAVHALKYQGRPLVATALSRWIANALPSAYRPDLVLGVPQHPARRRERGYDQAGLLAAATAGILGSPWLEGGLRRVRPTRPQAQLGSKARRANLAGAFSVVEPRALERRTILLIDDVITTGSTMEACLETLAGCGAHAIGAALAWAS